jgi:hypothetical protein
MLIAAFIFAISVGAMIQFVALSWRAGLLNVAAQGPAAGIELKIQDFRDVAALRKLSPDLGFGSVPRLRSVGAYYRVLQFFGGTQPGGWASREMALCMSYATVVLSQRLASNYALAAEMRSF